MGIVLILAGVVIIAVAVFLLSVRGAGKGKVRGGGAVIIGPIPIIFGTDKKSLKNCFVAITCAYGAPFSRDDRPLSVTEVKHTTEREEGPGNEDEGSNVSSKLLALLVLGFAIVIIGIIIIAVGAALGNGSASVGGVIFIGPFPIVFGAGPDAAWLIVISIVLAVVSIILFMLFRRRS